MKYLERFDMKIISANAEDLFYFIKNFAEDHEISFTDAKDLILVSMIGSLGIEEQIKEISRKLEKLA